MQTFRTSRGRSHPLGVSALATAEGVNFALLCRHGTSVTLVVYPLEGGEALTEIPLDSRIHRTGDHWHIQVGGLPPDFRYGWRVDGPNGHSHRFDPRIVLLDPAAIALSDGAVWGQTSEDDSHERPIKDPIRLAAAAAYRAGVPVKPPRPRASVRRSLFFRRPYNWHDDIPPLTPFEDTIIYELHVRGFTCHPSSGVQHPGTFLGIMEKIPYLQSLGVTAVELLPIHEFDECDCPFSNPQTGEQHRNFWGYNSICFAAPKASYADSARQSGQVNEFKEMVRAFHAVGIEVFLDVVFNHTGEGDDRGRTYSYRGLDNELYYLLGPRGEYLNFSGVGNTVNCNHPVVRDLLMTCLRYWVGEMHVDGLRFDLASVMGRDRNGNVLVEPPVVEMIAEDGLLRDTKLIAEPWDAAGLYQVGMFPFGRRWSEWNGQYRDEVRRFWRGEMGLSSLLATRMSGSSDLYEASGRQPWHSINFITCHDGFTLWDLVSYNHKHNLANGENNRDGLDDNCSWNSGVEGPTDDPAILGLRIRRAKALVTTMFLSQGVPMLTAGDEFLRTQQGNNNAWCQDNEISWVNWDIAGKNAAFLRFVRELIGLRRRHPALRRRTFFHGVGPSKELVPDLIWHGVEPFKPDFSGSSRTLAYSMDGSQTGREPDHDFYVACNAWKDPISFKIPTSPSRKPWRRVIDTALATPLDIVLPGEGPEVQFGSVYAVAPYSMIVLISDE